MDHEAADQLKPACKASGTPYVPVNGASIKAMKRAWAQHVKGELAS